MKSKELLSPSDYGNGKNIALIVCLLTFYSGCSEEIDFQLNEEKTAKTTAEKPSPKPDNNHSETAEAMIPKALHDNLMSEQETRCQALIEDLQNAQVERDKLLADLAQIETLKLELNTAKEETERLKAESQNYQAASQAAQQESQAQAAAANSKLQAAQAAASGEAAASTKAVKQLTADLAASQQQVKELQVSVSQMRNPADTLKIRELTSKNTLLTQDLGRHQQQIKTLQTSLNNPRFHQTNANMVKQLTEKNTALSRSLARSEKRVKDLQNSLSKLNKPSKPSNDNAVRQLTAQNTKLRKEIEQYKQQLRNQPPPIKDNTKTLAEWKTKLRNDGLMNLIPTTNQFSASVGRPHDKMDRLNSFEYQEVTYIWHDIVKVFHDLEIETTDGKITKVSYAEKNED